MKAAVRGTELDISVGAGKRAVEGGAMITVLPFIATREVPMRGGETLRYANLVRDIIPVGRWNGKAMKQRLQLRDTAQYDGVVVLLQAGTGKSRAPFWARRASLSVARSATCIAPGSAYSDAPNRLTWHVVCGAG